MKGYLNASQVSALLGRKNNEPLHIYYNENTDTVSHYSGSGCSYNPNDIYVVTLHFPATVADIKNFVGYRKQQLKRNSREIKHAGAVLASEYSKETEGMYGKKAVELIYDLVNDRLEVRLKNKGDTIPLNQKDYKRRFHIIDFCYYMSAEDIDDLVEWYLNENREKWPMPKLNQEITQVGHSRQSYYLKIDNDTYTYAK